jgi:hypothetical protein
MPPDFKGCWGLDGWCGGVLGNWNERLGSWTAGELNGWGVVVVVWQTPLSQTEVAAEASEDPKTIIIEFPSMTSCSCGGGRTGRARLALGWAAWVPRARYGPNVATDQM